MKVKIEVTPQVEKFLQDLSPEPRRRVRAGLRGLAHEEGDIKPLKGDFAPYNRLRVGSYRIIFTYKVRNGRRLIHCVLAEHRAHIYQIFCEIVTTLREMRYPASLPPGPPKPVRYKITRKKKLTAKKG